MKSFKYLSRTPQETMKLGAQCARHCQLGDIICLEGELGSGKTTFVKGLASGLKISRNSVHSPTFVLMNVYTGRLPLYHFDLYRIADSREVLRLDVEEYFYGSGIAVVEWAERLGDLFPPESLKVEFLHRKEKERLLKFTAQGSRYRELMEKVSQGKGSSKGVWVGDVGGLS